MSSKSSIVVVTSFFNKPRLLKSLYKSTSLSVSEPWRMLVIDNGSEGEYHQWIDSWKKINKNVSVIRRDTFAGKGQPRMGSAEHGAALDLAMDNMSSEKSMIVIADNDIIWLKKDWNLLFREKLNTFDHITTRRKNCPELPGPYISAFYMNFINTNEIKFSPRVDGKFQVLKPTEFNDVGCMLHYLPKEKWYPLSHSSPGIGYIRAMTIKDNEDVIAEHLGAGRKKSIGRIEKWINGCLDELRNNIDKVK